jgi:hypothetical protein
MKDALFGVRRVRTLIASLVVDASLVNFFSRGNAGDLCWFYSKDGWWGQKKKKERGMRK